MMVQSIPPHNSCLGDWHMQQPTLKKVRDWQGHLLEPRLRAVGFLMTGATGEGDAIPVPRHEPGVLEGAAAQIAGEICDHPRSVPVALHNAYVPPALAWMPQAGEQVEPLLRPQHLRQHEGPTPPRLPDR